LTWQFFKTGGKSTKPSFSGQEKFESILGLGEICFCGGVRISQGAKIDAEFIIEQA
jgi:hypothetical protein